MKIVNTIKNGISKIDTKYFVMKFFIILITTIFFALLAALVYNYVQYMSENVSMLQNGNNNKKMIVETISHVSYYIILCIGIMFVLVELGFNLNTILVVLGSVGLAVALAVQNSITNITSGFMILFMNYYDIGDLIETSDVMGHVKSFNLFNTTVENQNKVIVNVPNSSIVQGTLTNYYKEKTIKVAVMVNISNYDKTINIHELSEAIKEDLAKKCSFIIDTNDITVNVSDISKEGTLLKIKFPVESKNYTAAKNMANNIVRETIREKNVFLLDYFYKDKDGEEKNGHKEK